MPTREQGGALRAGLGVGHGGASGETQGPEAEAGEGRERRAHRESRDICAPEEAQAALMNRRAFLRGAALFVAAPAIVRATSLMDIAPWAESRAVSWGWRGYNGNIALELAAITRKAFVPGLFVQLYQASPVLAALEADLMRDAA